MATRELQDILNSGEILTIKLAGVADANALMQKAEIDARIAELVGDGSIAVFQKGADAVEDALYSKAQVDAAITAALGGITAFSYDYVKNNSTIDPGLADISENFKEVAQLTTPDRPAGTYEVGFSFTSTMDTTTKSVFIKWWDGLSDNDYVRENADRSDVHPMYYMYPKEHTGGPMTFQLLMRKEDAASPTLTCLYADIMCKRVA